MVCVSKHAWQHDTFLVRLPIGNKVVSEGVSVAEERISWCFEPNQPQRITSGLKTNFGVSQSYSFHKSL